MHDLVVRGAFIVDGTGAPGREADVAIDGEHIRAVGDVPGRGREELDARGQVLAPGSWIRTRTWTPTSSGTRMSRPAPCMG